jgi:Coenzyme PQQ synthesis protein D (PqqD)
MHETIEGEVILINLDTGTYYSLRETGADVWRGVEESAAEGEIVAALAETYGAAADEVAPSVAALLDSLEREQLIAPAEEPTSFGAFELSEREETRSFRAPVLEKHTDMQDLILLDPVHEVDARGWPHAAPPGTNS